VTGNTKRRNNIDSLQSTCSPLIYLLPIGRTNMQRCSALSSFRNSEQGLGRFAYLQPPHASSLRSSWAHRSIASALVDEKHASMSCSEDHILHRQQSLFPSPKAGPHPAKGASVRVESSSTAPLSYLKTGQRRDYRRKSSQVTEPGGLFEDFK
jgi:hypothetical protein